MDADILCQLIAQRIPAEQFQLWGLDVHWMKEEYDTYENRALVEDINTNYETLAAAYLASLQPTYRQLRKAEYPDYCECYLDTIVKQHSEDETIRNEGIAQEAKYFVDCLAVKARYPKV